VSDYEPSERLYTIGLNAACDPIVCAVRFLEDCVDGTLRVRHGKVMLTVSPKDVYKNWDDAKRACEVQR
jgi:hypothetical protein